MYAGQEKTMAQSFPRFCPRCGASNAAQESVCAVCGLDLTYRAAQPEHHTRIPQNAPPQTPTMLPSQHNEPAYQTQNYEQPMLPLSTPPKQLTGRTGRMGCVLALVL